MSENAKKKKRKGPSLEKQLEEAIANHAAEYKQWYHYWKYGGSDPFWPDGSNMHLIRNHIIYYKRQMKELCEQIGCDLPECYAEALPPEVDKDYMARRGEIESGAAIALEKFESYPAYRELLTFRTKLSKKQLESICYFNVLGYVEGVRTAIDQKDHVSMRRYGRYEHYLESFDQCLERAKALEPEEFQLSIFDMMSA